MAKFTYTNPALVSAVAAHYVNKAMLEIWRDARWDCPVDFGNLANSIIPEGPTVRGNTVVGYVGTNVTYGPFVEFGTRYMPARPFLGRALEKARRKYG
jgi:HK97 gp10 family phage protein